MADGETSVDRKRMYLVIATVVVLVVALAVYLLWPRTPKHVLVVGDSVSYMSWNALGDEFGSGTSLEAVTRPGYTSTELLPLVQESIDKREAAGHPLERAIFLVGYNDAWQHQVTDARLGELVELSARYECAIWLTLPARPGGAMPGIGDFDPELADAWNDLVIALVGEHGNLHLVTEWAEAIESASDTATYLEDDGIHPNEEGQKLLARIMHDRLLSECRFP